MLTCIIDATPAAETIQLHGELALRYKALLASPLRFFCGLLCAVEKALPLIRRSHSVRWGEGEPSLSSQTPPIAPRVPRDTKTHTSKSHTYPASQTQAYTIMIDILRPPAICKRISLARIKTGI